MELLKAMESNMQTPEISRRFVPFMTGLALCVCEEKNKTQLTLKDKQLYLLLYDIYLLAQFL